MFENEREIAELEGVYYYLDDSQSMEGGFFPLILMG